MKKYEKPFMTCLAMSSVEDLSAFSNFDSFEGALDNLGTTDTVNSYTWNSGLGYEA
jgi:hypothetical protein